MKYRIDKNGKKPAYILLYEQLRADIISGAYRYGAKLPSKRLLSEESGVSVVTVEHTYTLLCDEGYVESRERSGYFVIYREGDFQSSGDTGEVGPPVRSGAQTREGVFPFSVLAKTMRRVMLDRGEDILVKSPNNGCVELRSAIAAYLARSNGMTVDAEQIVIGSGAEYLYSLIAQLLRSRRFAIEDPSYAKIRQVYNACGVEPELLAMGRGGIRSSELRRSGASVLHITPFNSFPSGITAGATKRGEYIRWAEERDGYIVEDNYDSELTVSTKNEDTVFSLAPDRVIYLNTFSHTVAPSMRVGYMVLPRRLMEDFEARLGFYSCTVPVFEQYVLAELITHGDFERHINRVRRKKRREGRI